MNREIINNIFTDGQTDIELTATGDYNVVKDNYLSGSTARIDIQAGSTGHIIEGNKGYITENRGVASVTDGTWVSHGLVSTPIIVILTPQSDVNVWVMARTTTQFQVGVSTGTVTVDWYTVV